MKKLIIIVIILTLLLPSFVMGQNQANKYALIVSYDGSRANKIWASTCAKLLKTVLRENGFPSKNIKINTRASYSDLLDMADWLKSVENEDSEVVVGFFGHGSGTHACIKYFCMPHDMILDLLSDLKSQKQLVIIDTCGSAGAILPGKDGVSLNQTNRIVLTSTVLEIESSVFSWHLTRWSKAVLKWGLLEGNADFNGDGKVSIEEAGSVKGLISDGYAGEFFL